MITKIDDEFYYDPMKYFENRKYLTNHWSFIPIMHVPVAPSCPSGKVHLDPWQHVPWSIGGLTGWKPQDSPSTLHTSSKK